MVMLRSTSILLLASAVACLRLPSPQRIDRRNALLTGFGLSATGELFSGSAAFAEEPGSIFVGRYTDPINHPGGFRDISLLPNGLAEVRGGGGRGEPASFILPARMDQVDGKVAITIDFSPKGGPKDFTGVFEVKADGTEGIRFLRDKNFWPKQ